MAVKVKGTPLVFFPVPKNACSSVKYSLLNHNEDGMADRLPITGPDGKTVRYVHEIYPTRRFQWFTPLQYAGTRWFCVARDPVRRFLSGFGNRILHRDDLKRSKPGVLEKAGLSRHPDLEEFVAKLESYCAANNSVRHHFMPAVHYLGRRPDRYDRIFTMKSLGDIVDYCAEAGAQIALPHRQSKMAKLEIPELSATARAKLENFYAEDLRIWQSYTDG